MQTARSSKLYWSERGAISCAEHTPFRGSDTWVWERWKSMSSRAVIEFERELGHTPACETCAAIARNRGERS